MGHMPVIQLESGSEIEVRRLGIFELDQFQPELSGLFTYKMRLISGEEYEVEFDYRRYEETGKPIPTRPEMDGEPEPYTDVWFQLQEWELYEAAIAYEKRQQKARYSFYTSIIRHILTTCLEPTDLPKVITIEDWSRVYNAALCPQLYREDIERQLRETFKAKYDDKEIFDALQAVSGGHGVYDAIRLWENKVMLEWQKTEEEYALVPVAERARKVCALILENVMSTLEADRSAKERKKKKGAK